jgi:hypothetical protein
MHIENLNGEKTLEVVFGNWILDVYIEKAKLKCFIFFLKYFVVGLSKILTSIHGLSIKIVRRHAGMYGS